MKKKIRVKFDSLKRGDCFRLTLKGPVYMKDAESCGTIILGKGLGRIWVCGCMCNPLVYQVNVKIVEEK